jgi:hypothetical protein
MFRMITVAAALMVSGAGLAQAYTPQGRDIDRRQDRQERRIENGVRDGSLTRGEAARLNGQQNYINGLERSARRDGYISPREAFEIRRAQDAASRQIWAERHDRQFGRFDRRFERRHWGWPWGYGWGRSWY